MKKLLAICIPTYNRAAFIREFLESSFEICKRLGFDIYLADSGDDGETRRLVEDYHDSSLRHLPFPSDIHANEKVYRCFQDPHFSEEYEYLWMLSDTLRPSEELLEVVADALKTGWYDLFILNMLPGSCRTKEYTDANELFQDLFWCMILFGAVILRTDSMIRNTDWNALSEKYLIPSRISFSHVCFYFERLLELKNFRAFHLCLHSGMMPHSPLKTVSTWYHKETFEIWIVRIAEAASALPDDYRDKVEAWTRINRLGGSFSDNCMLKMREDRVLTPKMFFKYAFKWRRGTGFPLSRFIFYTFAGMDRIRAHVNAEAEKKRITHEDSLRELGFFCKDADIHIIGAGKAAKRVAAELQDMGISFGCFLVTEVEKNPPEIEGHPVKSVFDDMPEGNRYVAGLSRKNLYEVAPILPVPVRDNLFVPGEIRTDYETYMDFYLFKEKLGCAEYRY